MKFHFAILGAMIFGACQSPVVAATETVNGITYTYELTNGEATLLSIPKETQGAVTIPSELGGCPVVNIGFWAFGQRGKLTKIVFGGEVRNIGRYAFTQCTNLNSVSFSNTLTNIDENAFYNCPSLSSITLPDGLINIGVGAFGSCKKLSKISLPTSVLTIGANAFSGASITTITIPSKITVIADGLCMGCSNLISARLPENVRKIDQYAFCGCSNLTAIEIPESVTQIGDYAFKDCVNLLAISFPNNLNAIGNNAFSGCSKLVDITIPSTTTYLGVGAFHNCNELTSVKIDGNVTNDFSYNFAIGGVGAPFHGCSKLHSVTLGSNMTRIGDHMFYGATGLQHLEIPCNVTHIGASAFGECSNLQSLAISHSVTNISSGAFYHCSSLASLQIPSNVESIGSNLENGGAFARCTALTSVTIEGMTTGFDAGIFAQCTRLMEIVVPLCSWNDANAHLRQGNYAKVFIMDKDGNLIQPGIFQEGILPDGQKLKPYRARIIVNSIEECRMYSLRDKETKLPQGLQLSADGYLTGIPREAVDNYPVAITADDGQSQTFTITIHPIDYGWFTSGIWKYEVENNEAIIRYCTQQSGSVTVPETIGGYPVRTIEAAHVADYDADGVMTNMFIPQVVFFSGISSISLPSNLRNLGVGAVAGSSISSLSIPSGVTNIGHYAAASCTGLRSVTLRTGLKSIRDAAFKDCISLQNVQIPNSVEDMGVHVFDNCAALISASLSSGHGSVPAGTFANCQSLVNVVIPTSVTTIGKDAFSLCTSLRVIDVPDSVRNVGTGAFADCTSLGEFRCPSALEGVGEMCFLGCFSLTNFVASPLIDGFLLGTFAACESLGEIELPPNCRYLGKGCFSGCTSLTNIVWNNSLEIVDEWAFENCAALKSLRIPDSVSIVMPGALRGCTNLVSLSLPFVGITTNYMVETEFSGFGAIFGSDTYDGGVEIEQVFETAGNLFATWFVPVSLKTVEVRGGMLAPGAFSDCRSLEEIRLAGSPTEIPDYAFFGCEGLEEISIPDSVSAIGYAAFGNCGSLRSVRMPANVETVDSFPFYQCTNLVEVTWGETGHLRMENPEAGWFGLENVYNADGVSGLIWSVSTDTHRDWIEWFVEGTGELRTADHYAIITNGETRSFIVRVTDMSMTAADTELLHFTDDMSAPWVVEKDDSATGGFCLRSGEIPASTNSAIEATISGKRGTLSFKWRISAGRGDFCKFYLDGVEEASITRSTDWTTVLLDVPAGEHTVRWSYERGSGSATGEDAAFLDNVDWRPEVALSVTSAFGTTSPVTGSHTFVYGDEVTANVVAPEVANGMRRVCTGWTGTGSVPESGAGTSVTFSITNDSSIVWNWRTDYQTQVSVSGGSGDFRPQWVAAGSAVSVALSPATHLYEISLSGDTTGVTLDGTTLRFVVDRPRQIEVTISEVKLSLGIESAQGIPSPTNGVHALSWGTEVAASIAELEPAEGIQYLCTGWTGSGSIPSDGTKTNVTFVMEANSSLTWNWQTNFWLSLALSGEIAADFTEDWVEKGETVVAHLSPFVPFYTLGLSGDTGGIVLDEETLTLTIPADRPRTVSLVLSEFGISSVIGGQPLRWVTGGAAEWVPQHAVSRDGNGAVKTGQVVGDDVSILQTSLSGSGTFTWSWKLDDAVGGNAGVDVFLDGTWLNTYAPTADWAQETLEVTGEGEHVLRFEFWNAGTSSNDCAYLDEVVWTGETGPCASEDDVALALENETPTFSTNGEGGWFGQASHSANGSDAMQSGAVDDGEMSWLETTVEGPGLISFLWDAEYCAGTDFLEFLVDDIVEDAIGGTPTNWTKRSFIIGKGRHLLRWNAEGQGSRVSGWVDAVEWNRLCEVTLDRQQGSGGDESVIPISGETMPAITPPTRTGYTFGGYWTAANGDGVQYYTADGTSDHIWDKTNVTILYAKWTANNYAVTLDRQNGNGGTASVTATYGDAMPVVTPPSRTGYTFGGYWTEASGGGTQYYTADGTSDHIWDKSSATILYAKWIPNNYTITFDSAGGNAVASITTAYGAALPEPAAPTRDGYTFAGWLPTFPETMPLNGASLTAQWTLKNYMVTFDSAGGSAVASITAAYGAILVEPVAPTRDGYTFAGWSPAFPATMPLDGASLTAQWTPKNYTVTFDSAGGSAVASITAAYCSALAEPAAPTRNGYTFAGWSPAFPATMPLDGASLTALWTPKNYTVTFDSAGGSEVAPIIASYGSAIAEPAAPTRNGYTFAGWSPNFPSTMPLDGASLTAQWTPKNYTVSFDSAGGSEVASIMAAYGSVLTEPISPTKQGYMFEEWTPTLPATMPEGGATLVAQWSADPTFFYLVC